MNLFLNSNNFTLHFINVYIIDSIHTLPSTLQDKLDLTHFVQQSDKEDGILKYKPLLFGKCVIIRSTKPIHHIIQTPKIIFIQIIHVR